MEFKYEGNALKSGIYKITNSISGRVYIGSAKRFKERWGAHAAALRACRHQNKFLQSDFDKCFKQVGDDKFMVFEVLEMTDGAKKERLMVEEKFLLDHFDNCRQCYNMTVRAVSPDGSVRKNTEKTKQKRSSSAKQLWKDGVYANLAAKRSKEYFLLSPDSVVYMGANITNFCNEHGLSVGAISDLINGGRLTSKGWRVCCPESLQNPNSKKNHPKANRERMSELRPLATEKRIRAYTLIDPTGIIHKGKNVREFCKEHGLNNSGIGMVLRGEMKTYKGWKKVEMPTQLSEREF